MWHFYVVVVVAMVVVIIAIVVTVVIVIIVVVVIVVVVIVEKRFGVVVALKASADLSMRHFLCKDFLLHLSHHLTIALSPSHHCSRRFKKLLYKDFLLHLSHHLTISPIARNIFDRFYCCRLPFQYSGYKL